MFKFCPNVVTLENETNSVPIQRSRCAAWRSTTSTSLPCGWCASSRWPTSSSCSTSPPTSSSTVPSPPPSKRHSPRWRFALCCCHSCSDKAEKQENEIVVIRSFGVGDAVCFEVRDLTNCTRRSVNTAQCTASKLSGWNSTTELVLQQQSRGKSNLNWILNGGKSSLGDKSATNNNATRGVLTLHLESGKSWQCNNVKLSHYNTVTSKRCINSQCIKSLETCKSARGAVLSQQLSNLSGWRQLARVQRRSIKLILSAL